MTRYEYEDGKLSVIHGDGLVIITGNNINVTFFRFKEEINWKGIVNNKNVDGFTVEGELMYNFVSYLMNENNVHKSLYLSIIYVMFDLDD